MATSTDAGGTRGSVVVTVSASDCPCEREGDGEWLGTRPVLREDREGLSRDSEGSSRNLPACT